ncbi:alpha-(1,3)-fucosyltransferase C-like [Ylistrum balloti]|uniref:alpha-(1,3)-fucosyltransferase C-like n=1 Tax=Ylistrum balloti TaxID=509963 RepID=UPI002905F0C5|nr:alpha-(1,3)-fucosyltransferase C-like [Ylistrum balloti]
MDKSIICKQVLAGGEAIAHLRQKGSDGINKASRDRGDDAVASPGQKVHVQCRKDYCDQNVIRQDNNDKAAVSPCALPSLRSRNEQFNFRDPCLFCGQDAKLNDKKRGIDVYPVRTLLFQSVLLDICRQRSDMWSSEVEKRINMALDLPAADAVYHQSCSVNFRLLLILMSFSLLLLLALCLYLIVLGGTIVPDLYAIPMFLTKPPSKPMTVKLVTYYNKPPWVSLHVFDSCKYKCKMISSSNYHDSDVVVFHAPGIRLSEPLRKHNGQTWVFHALEPPFLIPQFQKWKRLFNWTMSYRRDADIFFPYGNFTKRTDSEVIDAPDIIWENKTRNLGWIVSHCGVASQRLKYGQKLQKNIDVDIYGRCGNLFCPRGKWKECIGQYKYYSSFENSLCIDYITEKSFRVFSQNIDSIPVTRGAPDYSIFLPPGSYVDTRNFSSISKLGIFLKKLSDDKESFKSYFNWRRYYKAEELGCERSFCELCRRLHNPSEKYEHLYEDIDEWVRQDSQPRRSCRPVVDII